MIKKYYLLILILFPFSLLGQIDTINVMYYNILNYPGTTAERSAYFREIIAYTKPDIIVVSELSSEAGADILLVNALNVNGIAHYQRALFIDGPDTDNMLFYNSNNKIFSLSAIIAN